MTAPTDAQDLARALDGQYEILREVGRGGMGIVFLARDLKLERLVAIKTLPPTLATDAVIRERFLREARTAAALAHPNIVPIHRADDLEGAVFFVMGYVDGPSMAQLVRDGGPLSPRTALSLFYDVAEALGYAHAAGVVHRDVKAENILVDQGSGRAMVTDFGIARVAEAAPLTATGTVLGTVHYMSPEQVAGDQVDRRSDIYSLGVAAFFALSGRFPFESPTASAVLVSHVTKEPPSLRQVAPSVPRPLADLIDRCLAKDPAGRIQSCEELVMELRRVESTLPATDVAAPRPGPGGVSTDEAQAIWLRAAELQEQTGQMPPLKVDRGALIPREAGTAAYQLDQVRNAGREAGIGTEFIDRALVERGLAAPAAAEDGGVPDVRDGIMPPYNWWLGGHSSVAYEVMIPGEMPERDFDLMADIIARTLNDAGTASMVGRSLKWASTDRQRKIQVSVLVREGRTTIYVGERFRDLIAGVYTGTIVGGGAGSVGPVVAVSAKVFGAPLLAFPGVLATTATMFAIARYFTKRTMRSRSAVLKALTERLAEQARDSIARRAVGPGMRQDLRLLR